MSDNCPLQAAECEYGSRAAPRRGRLDSTTAASKSKRNTYRNGRRSCKGTSKQKHAEWRPGREKMELEDFHSRRRWEWDNVWERGVSFSSILVVADCTLTTDLTSSSRTDVAGSSVDTPQWRRLPAPEDWRVEAAVWRTSVHTELGKFVSTTAGTNDIGGVEQRALVSLVVVIPSPCKLYALQPWPLNLVRCQRRRRTLFHV